MKNWKRFFSLLLVAVGMTGAVWAQTAAQYMQAGNSAYATKNYDQAIQYYQAVVNADPNSAGAYQGMGNCYYMKGDKANALSNYQKAQSLNPNNAQLNSMVQSLQGQVGTAPAASSSPQNNGSARAAQSGVFTPHFELSILAGVADDPGDSAVGFGGGVEGFYMVDPHLGIGGIVQYFNFSYSTVIDDGEYFNDEDQEGDITETDNDTVGTVEVMAAGKYRFDGKGIVPYIVVGVGIMDVMVSGSTTYNYSAGAPFGETELPNTTNPGTSVIDPMVAGGVGVEFEAGKGLNIFLEGRGDVVIGSGGTAEYYPLQAGANFDL